MVEGNVYIRGEVRFFSQPNVIFNNFGLGVKIQMCICTATPLADNRTTAG